MKRKKLFIIMLLLFIFGLSACSDKNASVVKGVDEAIDLVAENVTLESEESIVAARTAYDALTEDQKNLIKNYANLLAAEVALANLIEQDAANPVIALIAELPTAITEESQTVIVTVRAAYDALTDKQKSLVKNYVYLEIAEGVLSNQKAANIVIRLIADLPAIVTLTNETQVAAARAAYNGLSDNKKILVKNYADLEKAEFALANMKTYDVVLTGFVEGYKAPVIKVVREITGLGLKEAKEIVDNLPSTINENISYAEALALKEILEEAYGIVELRERQTTEEILDDQKNYNVVLTGVGEKKLIIIKVVREITELGLKEAKEIVDNLPSTIKENISYAEALAFKTLLEEATAIVELVVFDAPVE